MLLRWAAAIGAAVLLVGVVEFLAVSRIVEQRVLAQTTAELSRSVRGVEELLRRPDAQSGTAQADLLDRLDDVRRLRGARHVTLHGPGGAVIASVGRVDHAPDAAAIREVRRSGRATARVDRDGRGADERIVHEHLVPVRAPGGPMVLAVDMPSDLVQTLLADLRRLHGAGLLVVAGVAVPLSFALGGWWLLRDQRRDQRSADTDALTGLLGRRPFAPALRAALAAPEPDQWALALIDLDDFKYINDRLGHRHGDRVLRELADSFQHLRETDLAFRIGGDEFAVLLPGVDEQQAASVLERARAAFTVAQLDVTMSIGVASAPTGGAVDPDELWERADAALYEAKRRGRRQTVLFASIAEGVAVTADKLAATQDLLTGDHGFGVVFQPIWDLAQGRVLGHEALLRLPVDAPLDGPSEALRLADRLGCAPLLDALGREAVLQRVADCAWYGLLFLNMHPASLRTLRVADLVADVEAAGLQASEVVVEVTEQADLDRAEDIRALKSLREAGFLLALDDLGAGNAGLRALGNIDFDVVKLDRAVVGRSGIDPAADATLAAARMFAARTGGWVIAEGIETAGDLRSFHATHDPNLVSPRLGGQGYFLGRPAAVPRSILTRLEASLPNPG
ncbi:diguanylate cyclase domain-containing protein [Egicoccus sp. AB-alg2]|uniref:diguanylate cyclase domain-containing protein n=1 Tax=Egicoccus sp. AB-alg2 TaxID=3242693 RepID=UPI00359CF17C